jgi:thioredoxin reductase (NADPH)
MSRYLIDRIRALPNVELHGYTEIVTLHGDRSDGLSGVTFRNLANGTAKRCEIRHLFLFIGADPHAEWLAKAAAVDEKGFLLTGQAFAGCADSPARAPFPLETSMPGVFAIGDVRAGSTKRVAAAVGEGAAVVAQIHQLLATTSTTS